MHYLIYKITNKLDNKIYVGKHKTENKNDNYYGSGLLLNRAMNKHGRKFFSKEILMECSSEAEMNQKESDIVDALFISRDDTYNVKLGGPGGFDFINKCGKNIYENHSKISRENVKIAHMSFLEKLNFDAEFKEEWKAKISAKVKLNRVIFGNPFSGEHHTDATKKRISKSMQGKHSGKKNPNYGNRWITDGSTNRLILRGLSLPIGFRFGRV